MAPGARACVWGFAVPAALLLLSVAGLVLALEFYLYREYAHQHNVECVIGNCSTQAQLCGSQQNCYLGECYEVNVVCLHASALLQYGDVAASHWQSTNELYTLDTCVLTNPPPCNVAIPDWVDIDNNRTSTVPCYYDDRDSNGTLVVGHQEPFSASGGAIATLTLLSAVAFVALIWLVVGLCVLPHT